MSDDDDDKELEDLLNEFNDPLPVATPKKDEAPASAPAAPAKKSIVQPTHLVPKSKELTDEDIQPEALSNNLRALLARYRGVAEEVLDNCRNDRLQAQAVIDHFFNVINDSPKIPNVYIEKFPDLLRTKNEIGATSVRLLGELTKLVSASKNSELLGKVDVNIDIIALSKLLEEDD